MSEISSGELKYKGKLSAVIRHDTCLVIIIFTLALIIRLLYIYSMKPTMLLESNLGLGYDMSTYHRWGCTIAEGDWIGKGVFYQIPLLPYLLGIVYTVLGNSYFNGLILMCIIGSLIPVLLFLIGQRLFNKWVGIITAVLAIFYGPFIYYCGLLKRCTLLALLLLTCIYFFLRAIEKQNFRDWVFSGLALGLATLGGPNALFLAPFLLLWALVQLKLSYRRKIVCLTIFTLSMILMIAPVTIRNYIMSGKFYLVTSHSTKVWKIGNSYDSTGWNIAPKKPLIPVFSVDFIKLQLRKFALFWNNYEIPNNTCYYLFRNNSGILKVLPLNFMVVLSIGILGIALSRRYWRKLMPLYITIGIYSGFIILCICISRLRMPVVPFIMIFTAYSIFWWIRQVRQKAYLPLLGSFLSVFIMGYLVTTPATQPLIPPMYYCNLGDFYRREKGMYRKAIPYYEKAIKVGKDEKICLPAFASLARCYLEIGQVQEGLKATEKYLLYNPADLNWREELATLYRQDQNYQRAIYHWKEYLKVKPDSVVAHNNLGSIYVIQDRLDEAIKEYQTASRLKPDYVKAYYNLGLVYMKKGLLPQAEIEFKEVIRLDPNNKEAREHLKYIQDR